MVLQKKGCKVEFTIKTFYLLKHVSELCFIQQNHVNQDGLHVHGDFKIIAHLLEKIKDFVMEQLMFGLTVFQIMTKHRQHVKNIMLGTCELNINMFLT